MDHVVPRWRGGLTQEDNLVLACHPCNQLRALYDNPPGRARSGRWLAGVRGWKKKIVANGGTPPKEETP